MLMDDNDDNQNFNEDKDKEEGIINDNGFKDSSDSSHYTELSHSQSEQGIELERDYSFELNQRYHLLLESYAQRKYKKTRKDIIKLSFFSDCNDYWKLIHLKLKCQEKIIERKLNKVNQLNLQSNPKSIINTIAFNTNTNSNANANSKTKAKANASNANLKSILKWLSTHESDIQYWIKIVLTYTFNVKESSNKLELLITFLLNQCLFYAKYCVHQSLLDDCLSFLALAENLIRKVSSFITSPDTLFTIEQLYLFSSSLYISNENYLSAKQYLILILKLSFKEIQLRIDNDNQFQWIIFFEELQPSIRDHLIEILFNITTAMYQLGVCYENEGDLDKTLQAYRQSKWFANAFLYSMYPGLIEFINDLERRTRLRIELCDFIKREEKNLGDIPVKPAPKAKNYYNELEKIKKFEKLQKYIESLKLNEVDDDEVDLLNDIGGKPMSQRVNVATRTIHVLNHLMSTKFQKVIKESERMEINKLDKDTKRVIEKTIMSIKANEKIKMNKESNGNGKHLETVNTNANMNMNKTYNGNDKDNGYLATTIPTMSNESTINGQTQSTFFNQSIRLNRNDITKQKRNIKLIDMKERRPITAFSKSSVNTTTNNHNTKTSLQHYYSNHFTSSSQYQNKKTKRYYGLKTTSNSLSKAGTNTNGNRNANTPKTIIRPKSSKPSVEKIYYSQFVFNKSFRKKIDCFRGQFDKELKFQKNLLNCKLEEKRVVQFDINPKAIRSNCEKYFSNEYKKQKKIIKEENEAKKKMKESINSIKATIVNSIGIRGSLGQCPHLRFGKGGRGGKNDNVINTEANNKYYLNKVEYDIENISKSEEYLQKKTKELKIFK